MALNIILAYKTQNRLETPHLAYAGQNGDEAQAAAQKAAGAGYVRFERCVEPLRYPYVPPAVAAPEEISQPKPKSKSK